MEKGKKHAQIFLRHFCITFIECDKQNICQVCPPVCYAETGSTACRPDYIHELEAENQEEYEEQAAEIQERIDELEETISNIYDRLEEE